MKRTISRILAIVVALGVAGYIFYDFEGDPSNRVSIGIATWPGFAPSFLARKRGYFGGLDVTIDVVDDFSARQAAFVSGNHDFTIYTIDSFAFDAGKGVDGSVVLVLDESRGADGIIARLGITGAADLKGKAVAYTRGSPAHFLLVNFLREGGLTVNDIKTVEVDDPTRAAQAFIAKSVDAAVTWEPHLSAVKAKNIGNVIADTRTRPGLIVDVLVASRTILKERPEVVRTVVQGWLKAIADIKNNSGDAFSVMADGLGIKEAEFKAMAGGLIYATDSMNKHWLIAAANGKTKAQLLFERASEIWRGEKLSDSPTSSDNYFDGRFVLTLSKP